MIILECFPGHVAPFTGAWIEIIRYCELSDIVERVAPFTGAWIEIIYRR